MLQALRPSLTLLLHTDGDFLINLLLCSQKVPSRPFAPLCLLTRGGELVTSLLNIGEGQPAVPEMHFEGARGVSGVLHRHRSYQALSHQLGDQGGSTAVRAEPSRFFTYLLAHAVQVLVELGGLPHHMVVHRMVMKMPILRILTGLEDVALRRHNKDVLLLDLLFQTILQTQILLQKFLHHEHLIL